ncbi:hypothetical protein LOAG_00545 [Loa loa]|uniref:Uncharacterized protein n=1 Tax=Loa loa TaxID=7209 RepID=A0A1S0UB10_LOALO|nr:hypothetical protein LOAG_00545 [Loa loa]EFO27931.1 hypothetical protein LOAG_00545 [Loa loa]
MYITCQKVAVAFLMITVEEVRCPITKHAIGYGLLLHSMKNPKMNHSLKNICKTCFAKHFCSIAFCRHFIELHEINFCSASFQATKGKTSKYHCASCSSTFFLKEQQNYVSKEAASNRLS